MEENVGMEGYSYNEMCWPEIKEVVKEKRVAILPVGAIENHGPHLPLDADTVIVEEVCKRAAKKMEKDVAVLPVVPYGLSVHHIDFPGTITIKVPTFTEYIQDICKSLAFHGFKYILIVNGHGGNIPSLQTVARTIVFECPGVLCMVVSWWHPKKVVDTYKNLKIYDDQGYVDHGGISETSIYMAVKPYAVNMEKATRIEYPKPEFQGLKPEEVPTEIKEQDYYLSYWSGVTKLGNVGDPTKATVEKGEALLNAAAQSIVDTVKALKQMKPRERVDHH